MPAPEELIKEAACISEILANSKANGTLASAVVADGVKQTNWRLKVVLLFFAHRNGYRELGCKYDTHLEIFEWKESILCIESCSTRVREIFLWSLFLGKWSLAVAVHRSVEANRFTK